MKLTAYGITTDLPPGWEGRISRRQAPTTPDGRTGERGTPGEAPQPVAHLANFVLPEDRGDFGSGAVDVMGTGHVFLALFEYGPESLGQPLFAPQGIPELRPNMFSATSLQRVIQGQAGCQRFFTVNNRPFCLYAVLGRQSEAPVLAPAANLTLRATRIDPR